jgi:short-subunit dehydrogenase
MNQWVLITGAAGGLGKAFAAECASRGWNLYLTDLCGEQLETLAGGLRNTYGVIVETHPGDLTDAASRAELFDLLARDNHKFSMLVNVAGLDYEGSFYERTSSQIRTIVRLNIEGTLDVTHALLRYRDPLSTFRIITIASLAAFFPMPVKATYAASKRFLLDFSLALREEVRSLGATVTVVCPAGLPTTRECIEAIEAQGLFGQLTTQNTGTVAAGAIDAALRGRTVYIPGLLNRIIQVVTSILPAGLLAAVIGWRWRTARNAS